jgi:hypothetical protein
MLSSKFLNSEEMQKLDIKHGLEGCGAIMFIFEYLVDRTNGLGSYISVPSLARSMGKNKKFLLDIINNYGLFCSPKDTIFFTVLICEPLSDCQNTLLKKRLKTMLKDGKT